MAELTLYVGNKNYSSWSMRPWLALKHTGAPFDEVVIALDQRHTAAELAKVSPSGRVPVLVHGELKIWESLAICEYLAETFPKARLWPDEKKARAFARSVSNEMHAGFGAVRQALSMNIRKRIEKPRTPEVDKELGRICQLWRTCREQFGLGGPYLFGHFTIADCMYAPVVSRFRTYGVPTGALESAYRDAIEAHPAYREWVAAAEKELWELPNH